MEQKKNIDDGYYVQTNKNYQILMEADKIGWRVATKTKGMLAVVLDREVRNIPTLEGLRNAKPGEVFCIGFGGEYWVQSIENVNKKYVAKGAVMKEVKINKENYNWEFTIYEPKPGVPVLACVIKHEFRVSAPWAELKGKKGDYILKNFSDNLNPDPKDVWLVDKGLFESTYEIK